MDAIYGQAVMTIVALAASNASSSLFDASDISAGLGPVLREMEHWKNVEFIPDFRLTGTVIQEADKPGYVYRTCGWSFQEEQISRRLLYCRNRALYLVVACTNGVLRTHGMTKLPRIILHTRIYP